MISALNKLKKIRRSVLISPAGATAATALVLAFAVSGALVVLAGLPGRLVEFTAVLALQVARRPLSGSPLVRLLGLAAVAVLTALLGELVLRERAAADVVIVAAFSASFAVRRAPGRLGQLRRWLSLPVVVLFVAPVGAGARGADAGWYLPLAVVGGACALAAGWLVRRAEGGRALRAAPARFVRVAAEAAGSPSRLRALRRLGAELDERLGGGARVAALRLELAAAADPGDVEAAAAALSAALEEPVSAVPEPRTAPPPERVSRLRPGPTTRVALHSGLALALALVVSQLLYPDRWGWTVVAVLAISSGLRSRGDVLVRAGERLLGALVGTAAATALAAAIGADKPLAIALVLSLVAVGSLVRDAAYTLYAFCVTSALALVYGLFGERGTQLLGQRLVENVIGAACIVLVSCVVLPIPTEAVVRRRLADALAALADLLAGVRDGSEGAALVAATRTAARRAEELDEAVRAISVHGHVLRFAGRETPAILAQVTAFRSQEEAARALVHGVLARGGHADPEAVGALVKSVGRARRALADSSRSRLAVPDTARAEPQR
jgi:Fusaric acid resistance protein-like